jgi:SAM-dependent methyltransferase
VQSRLDEIEKYDALFERWRERNPSGTFSQFSTRRIAQSIRAGKPHTTLGPKLVDEADWWTHGGPVFETVRRKTKVVTGRWSSSLKICDYGCGSLRVGVHFIKHQDAGCFVGLDVTEDFIAHGKQFLKNEIEEKKPILGIISEKIDAAVGLGIDVLFSHNVASHVHPDEIDAYFGNIKRIVHKPGSMAIIQVLCSETPQRFQRSGWAWPLNFYHSALLPLRAVRGTPHSKCQRNGIEMTSHMILVRRR